ncbi:hypothetical protein IWZ00DRAFT_352839 [Phyllosticta capitalensis]
MMMTMMVEVVLWSALMLVVDFFLCFSIFISRHHSLFYVSCSHRFSNLAATAPSPAQTPPVVTHLQPVNIHMLNLRPPCPKSQVPNTPACPPNTSRLHQPLALSCPVLSCIHFPLLRSSRRCIHCVLRPSIGRNRPKLYSPTLLAPQKTFGCPAPTLTFDCCRSPY